MTEEAESVYSTGYESEYETEDEEDVYIINEIILGNTIRLITYYRILNGIPSLSEMLEIAILNETQIIIIKLMVCRIIKFKTHTASW